MELILKEDVVNLGYKNDIVTVKSGYGRNYLIPPLLFHHSSYERQQSQVTSSLNSLRNTTLELQ